MLIKQGPLAHSHFRLERWLSQIHYIVPQVSRLSAEFIYFIDVLEQDGLTNLEIKTLSCLLNDGIPLAESIDLEQTRAVIIIAPKVGNISAWSSQATNIAHQVGLQKIRRIERGVVYSIEASERLTWGDEQGIAQLLHDPATEIVLYRPQEASRLFEVQASKVDTFTGMSEHQSNLSAGITGFSVSNLNIPGFCHPWEIEYGVPKLNATALEIMLEAPVAIAQLNNELGRPSICGYFRTYEQWVPALKEREVRGYHKPILIAEGIGRTGTDSDFLFSTQKMQQVTQQAITTHHLTRTFLPLHLNRVDIEEIVFRLLRLPCIADKSFLITICDRTVGGLVARDQLVGPWQVPVADCAVVANAFDSYEGIALALGERSPLAVVNPLASARIAIGEAITNIAAACIGALSDVRLSAFVRAAYGYQDEDTRLSNTMKALLHDFCPALGLTLVVDDERASTTLQTIWTENADEKKVIAPISFIVNAVAPVFDIRKTVTPLLSREPRSVLIFLDLSHGHQRLGGSALAQVTNQVGDAIPDVEAPKILADFFACIQRLKNQEKILAYHDRSDGGLFITLCEMAFASHIGLQIDITELGKNVKAILFNEELGAVIQVHTDKVGEVLIDLDGANIPSTVIGSTDITDQITFVFYTEIVFAADRVLLQKSWSETSFQLQSIRDNPRCAKKQFETLDDRTDPGLTVKLNVAFDDEILTPFINKGARPKIAILREQGITGYEEMAAAFTKAQFECVEVHTNDLLMGNISLSDCKGLAVCNGFSFGDCLGAGQGWAKRILLTPHLKEQFEQFFYRTDTFTIGVGNGCQMLSHLKALIPGAELWPRFVQNYSEQFESRLCLVEVQPSTSILLSDMVGSRLLVPVAHALGRAEFTNESMLEEALHQGIVALRYVDNRGRKTKSYPANPSGSPLGITGLTTLDGRVTILMPLPERAFRTVQYAWHPEKWGENAPWIRLFQNARRWLG